MKNYKLIHFGIGNVGKAFVQLLKENKVRCEKYVPIEEAIGNPALDAHAFSENNMADLESRNIPGLSRKSPLFDIAKIHEKNSFDILSRVMKLEKEAALAGAHHDYDGSHARMIEKYLYTVSSFYISAMLAEFLSLSDMYQAIKDKRSYKSAETQLEALNDLADIREFLKLNPLNGFAQPSPSAARERAMEERRARTMFGLVPSQEMLYRPPADESPVASNLRTMDLEAERRTGFGRLGKCLGR